MRPKSVLVTGVIVLFVATVLGFSAGLIEDVLFGDYDAWRGLAYVLSALGVGLILLGVWRSSEEVNTDLAAPASEAQPGYLERLNDHVSAGLRSGWCVLFLVSGACSIGADAMRGPYLFQYTCTFGWLVAALSVVSPSALIGAAFRQQGSVVGAIAWIWVLCSTIFTVAVLVLSGTPAKGPSFFLLSPPIALLVVTARLSAIFGAALFSFRLITHRGISSG